MHSFFEKLKDYKHSKDGQFALWFAVAAFPLMVGLSAVIDFRKAESRMGNVKSALDSAVLAAAADNAISIRQKEQMAVEVFDDNYTGDLDLTLNVVASLDRVEMTASGNSPTTLGEAVGMSGISINERSIAEMAREDTICVLSLAREGEGMLRFLDRAQYTSPNCSVQSNSDNIRAIVSESTNAPSAKSFCSVGGGLGIFQPALKGSCLPAPDPYANRTVPEAGVCMPETLFFATPTSADNSAANERLNRIIGFTDFLSAAAAQHGNDSLSTTFANISTRLRLELVQVSAAQASRMYDDYSIEILDVTESDNYTGSDRLFFPGTYCGGLTIDGQNVIFSPGTYIIKDGPLTFKNKSVAYADDVTFVFQGENTVVTVESGSIATVNAPSEGDMAGMAFFEDASENFRAANAQNMPTGVNVLSSGGELNVTGAMYFPTQAIDVVGDSVLGANAPATSFIAYQVTFSGDTRADVKVDHVAAGIPPQEPRSDDGARLVY